MRAGSSQWMISSGLLVRTVLHIALQGGRREFASLVGRLNQRDGKHTMCRAITLRAQLSSSCFLAVVVLFFTIWHRPCRTTARHLFVVFRVKLCFCSCHCEIMLFVNLSFLALVRIRIQPCLKTWTTKGEFARRGSFEVWLARNNHAHWYLLQILASAKFYSEASSYYVFLHNRLRVALLEKQVAKKLSEASRCVFSRQDIERWLS